MIILLRVSQFQCTNRQKKINQSGNTGFKGKSKEKIYPAKVIPYKIFLKNELNNERNRSLPNK